MMKCATVKMSAAIAAAVLSKMAIAFNVSA